MRLCPIGESQRKAFCIGALSDSLMGLVSLYSPIALSSLYSLSPFCFFQTPHPTSMWPVPWHSATMASSSRPGTDFILVLLDLVEGTKHLLPFFCYQQLDLHFMTCLLRLLVPFLFGPSYLLRLLVVLRVLCYTLSSFHKIPIVTLTWSYGFNCNSLSAALRGPGTSTALSLEKHMQQPEPLKVFFCLFNGDVLEKHRQNSVKIWDPDSLPNVVPKNQLPVSPIDSISCFLLASCSLLSALLHSSLLLLTLCLCSSLYGVLIPFLFSSLTPASNLGFNLSSGT